jgi:hypothetical protein
MDETALKKYGSLAAPVIFILFILTLAPWLYDFPLNDDWAYAIGVKNLLGQGTFALCDWAAATQLAHLLGGALFAKLFGFSFTILKTYTLTVSAGALFIFVKILEEFEIAPFDRNLAALVVALNPLFLVLANSFMTDMTYFFWMTASSYFYIRHLKTGRQAGLMAAGLCAAAACLTRQLGMTLPLAYTLILARERKLNAGILFKTWIFPFIAVAGYALWLKHVHGPTWASENYVFSATLHYLSATGMFILHSLHRLVAALLEIGLLLFPLAAGYLIYAGGYGRKAAKNAPHRKHGAQNRAGAEAASARPITLTAITWLALAVFAVFALYNKNLTFPENNFGFSGFGVLTLGGNQFKPSSFFSSALFWSLLTALAAISATAFVRFSQITLAAKDPAAGFVFLSAVIHFGISILGAKFFDRYLINFLPWFILAAVLAAKELKFSKPAAILALALMAALSWAGVKDYMQWNRAKWELAERPRPDLKPGEIAAGFDHDAWYTYTVNMTYLKSFKPLKMIGEWEWQSINNYKAMASFSPQTGLPILDQIEYTTPLSTQKGVIYLLRLPAMDPAQSRNPLIFTH